MVGTPTPKVCISVLNWNNYEQTIRCLHSLAALTYPHYKIVVVDNASSDNSAEHIREAFPDLEIIETESNLGYAGGNELALNRALVDGETELFWILNNDATVRPDSLSQLVTAYLHYGDAIYGGVPIQFDSTEGTWIVAMTLWKPHAITHALVAERLHGRVYDDYFAGRKPRVTTIVGGATLMVPISVVRHHGFMDTGFFMYSEESDYCLRLGREGIYSILVPSSVILHERAGSRHGKPDLELVMRYYQMRNRLILFRRHSTRLSYVALLLQTLLRASVAKAQSALGRREKAIESRYIFRAFYDGLRGRMGKTFAPEDYLDISSHPLKEVSP